MSGGQKLWLGKRNRLVKISITGVANYIHRLQDNILVALCLD